MPPAFGSFKKQASHKAQRSANPAQSTEDEHLPVNPAILTGGQSVSKDVLHRTILGLQRTVGNQATQQLISQRSASPTVQRAIAYGGDRKPVLATLFDDAERVVMQLTGQNYLQAYQNTLQANNPLKTAAFAVVWANAAARAAISQLAIAGFVPENPAFLDAVTAYKAAPTVATAIQIIDTYLTQGAASEVNIDAVMRTAYGDAKTALNRPAAAPVALAVEVDDNWDDNAVGRGRGGQAT